MLLHHVVYLANAKMKFKTHLKQVILLVGVCLYYDGWMKERLDQAYACGERIPAKVI